VAGLGLLDRIQRQRADGVDAELIGIVERSGHTMLLGRDAGWRPDVITGPGDAWSRRGVG
jgi:hypothetical protein